MHSRLLTGIVAAAMAATLAVASPVLARGGGGGHGGFGGGGHGGFGGGGHFSGGMRAGGISGMHVGGMSGARFAHVGGPALGGARFAHAAIGPGFAGAGWHGRPFIGRHAFFRHHHRFFVGAPFIYAGYYDGCWRRSWTPYGWQWVNVCGDYW